MLQVVVQQLKNIQNLWLIIHKRQHNHTEGILQLCVLVELVQDDICVGVAAQLNNDAHALAAGVVIDGRNAVYFFVTDKLGDLLDQPCLVDHVGKFSDDDLRFSVRHRLNIRHAAHADLAAAGAVCLINTGFAENLCAGRKIGSLDDRQNLVNGCISAFIHTIVNNFYDSGNHLTQIMRGDVCRHADGDTCRSVDKEVRNAGRKNGRLLLRIIKVRYKINGILAEIAHHLHGDL